MKKNIVIILFIAFIFNYASAQKYMSGAGQEAGFNAKYKLTASIDDKTMLLKWSTDAPVIKAVLSVYTPEQLAVRKGTDHTYPFKTPVNSYQFNLNAPAFKDYYAYWLKVYTTDGLWQEYFFRKKEPVILKKEDIKTDDIQEEEGYTLIKTTINCETGKQKVIDALKALEGVFDVKIDIKTGKLLLKYSSDGTPYTEIIDTVLNNGFDADGKKTTKASLNPCKKRN